MMVAVGYGLSALLMACGTASTPDAGSTTESSAVPTTTTDVSPAPTPSASVPVPSPTAQPTAPVVATVADLEQHLAGQSHGLLAFLGAPAPGAGEPEGLISCQGSGPLQAGDAITCRWEPVLPADVEVWGCENPPVDGCGGGQWPDPHTVLVAVLDDTGRYTFTLLDDREDALFSAPSDYPEGTTSCATLRSPPAGRPTRYGLAYPALLHHWMSLGQPDVMDSDGDGRPCEDTFPPEIVTAVVGSALTPVRDPGAPSLTMDDVRAHAQAHMTGYLNPLVLSGAGGHQPATTGAAMACQVYSPSWPNNTAWQLYLVVLDGTGGYLIVPDTSWHSGGVCPGLDDYPPGSACAELAQPPPGWTTCSRGVGYGEVLYQWFTLGQPTDWDTDGDGRPCEDTYPHVSNFLGDDPSEFLLQP